MTGDWQKDWPVQPSIDRKTKEPTLTNSRWRALLGEVLFGLSAETQDDDEENGEPTFRFFSRTSPDVNGRVR